MSEAIVATKTVFVWVNGVDVISNLWRGDPLYLDVSGSAQNVLGIGAASHLGIVGDTAVATVDGDR